MQKSDQGNGLGKAGTGRLPLFASIGLFLIFLVNVIVGKIAITQGATSAPGLGDVGEFLVLFAAVALFIAACLKYERRAREDENT